VGIDPAALARAIRRSRRRCIALELDLLELGRAVDLWRQHGSSVELVDVLGVQQARGTLRRLGASLELDAAGIEALHGLPPQDGPPAPPAPPARTRAHENLEALKRSMRRG